MPYTQFEYLNITLDLHPRITDKIESMADNYIERQYEQYEARKAAWEKARKYGKKKTGITHPARTEQPGQTTTEPHHYKRVFVTGGANGIGKAIVEIFCKSGYRVAFCDKDEIAGKRTAEETGAIFHQVDISDKDMLEHCMQSIIEEWDDIDILINNAGISDFSPITETSIEDFDRILSINLRPVFYLLHASLAIHRQSQTTSNPYGRIINICSTRYLMSESGSEGYAASKGGIYSLTHAFSLVTLPNSISQSILLRRAGYKPMTTIVSVRRTMRNTLQEESVNRKI